MIVFPENKIRNVPSSLVSLTSLRTLDVSHNALHSAEDHIFQMRSLQYLGRQNLDKFTPESNSTFWFLNSEHLLQYYLETGWRYERYLIWTSANPKLPRKAVRIFELFVQDQANSGSDIKADQHSGSVPELQWAGVCPREFISLQLPGGMFPGQQQADSPARLSAAAAPPSDVVSCQ